MDPAIADRIAEEVRAMIRRALESPRAEASRKIGPFPADPIPDCDSGWIIEAGIQARSRENYNAAVKAGWVRTGPLSILTPMQLYIWTLERRIEEIEAADRARRISPR